MSEYVKGLSKLISTLEKIPPELDKQVDQVLEANAREIERNAKRNAPVDTGKLQQSIKAEKQGEKTFTVRSNSTGLAPYDKFVEFGTYKMRAQPFLYPAYFKQIPQFTKDLESLLKRTFKK